MQQYLTTTHHQQTNMTKTFSRFKYNRGSLQEKSMPQSPLNPRGPTNGTSRPIVVQKDVHIKIPNNKHVVISPDSAQRVDKKFSNLMT